MSNLQTLKLDSAFNPIGIVSWEEGLVLTLMGKAFVLEAYDDVVRSQKETFQIPAVVVLKKYIKYWVAGSDISCIRKNVLIRDEYRCQYCYKFFAAKDLTLDHVMPKSRNGKKEWKNMVSACLPCNQRKGAHTPKEAGFKLFRTPKRPTMRESLRMTVKFSHIVNETWKPYLK